MTRFSPLTVSLTLDDAIDSLESITYSIMRGDCYVPDAEKAHLFEALYKIQVAARELEIADSDEVRQEIESELYEALDELRDVRETLVDAREAILALETELGELRMKTSTEENPPQPLFHVGQRVYDKWMGVGTVQCVDTDLQECSVEFDSHPSYAPDIVRFSDLQSWEAISDTFDEFAPGGSMFD